MIPTEFYVLVGRINLLLLSKWFACAMYVCIIMLGRNCMYIHVSHTVCYV